MDPIKLLLILIIVTLAQFNFVKAGLESQVFIDLIDQFNGKPEWKNCLIITLDLKQELALQMVGHYPNESFLHLDNKTDFVTLGVFFQMESKCLFVVSKAENPFLEALEILIRRVRWKRFILLVNGDREKLINFRNTYQNKKLQTGSFIVQDLNKTSPNQIKTFLIHLVCPNCDTLLLENVDVWKEKVGFIKYGNKIMDLFSTRCCSGQSPLLGRSVTVSVIGIPPYVTFDPETKALGGIDVELFKIIARKFLLRVTMRPEKTWLDKLENGTIIGTVASVYQGISDIGIGDIAYIRNRYQLIDYTKSLYQMENGFLSRKPEPLERYKNIVMPFDNFVWTGIASASVLMSVSIYIVYWTSEKNNFKKEKNYSHPSTRSIDFILFPIVMLVTQSEPHWLRKHAKSYGANILITFWSVACTVIIFFYISNLRASLISVEKEAPIDTVRRVVEENKPVYFPRGTFLEIAMKYSTRKDLKELYAMAERLNPYVEYKGGSVPLEAMMKIKREGSGIATKDLFKYSIRNFMRLFGAQPFHFSKEIWLKIDTGFVVQKHSYMLEEIDRVILNLIEFGILDKLFKSYDFTTPNDGNDDSSKNLSVGHFLSSIFFLSIFSFVSLVIFLCELGCHKKAQK